MQQTKREARSSQVTCNECGRRFAIVPQIERLDDGGEKHFFACPHCQAEYVTARISPRGVEIRETMRQLKEQFSRLPQNAAPQRERLRQQLEGWQWELEGEITGA